MCGILFVEVIISTSMTSVTEKQYQFVRVKTLCKIQYKEIFQQSLVEMQQSETPQTRNDPKS